MLKFALAALLLQAGSAVAQSIDDVEIGIEPVADNVYVLTGRGGAISAWWSPTTVLS